MLCRSVLIFWVVDMGLLPRLPDLCTGASPRWRCKTSRVLLISSSCSSSSSSMIDSMSWDVCLDMDGLAAFRTCPLSSSSTLRQDVSDDANSFNFSVFSSSHFRSVNCTRYITPAEGFSPFAWSVILQVLSNSSHLLDTMACPRLAKPCFASSASNCSVSFEKLLSLELQNCSSFDQLHGLQSPTCSCHEPFCQSWLAGSSAHPCALSLYCPSHRPLPEMRLQFLGLKCWSRFLLCLLWWWHFSYLTGCWWPWQRRWKSWQSVPSRWQLWWRSCQCCCFGWIGPLVALLVPRCLGVVDCEI